MVRVMVMVYCYCYELLLLFVSALPHFTHTLKGQSFFYIWCARFFLLFCIHITFLHFHRERLPHQWSLVLFTILQRCCYQSM